MSLPVPYLRSSSYSTHDLCPMKYFGEYVLGWTGKNTKAAILGTTVHKSLELLAVHKLTYQNGEQYFSDEILGRCFLNGLDSLTQNETNKEITKDDIIEIVYNYYTSSAKDIFFGKVEYKKCLKWYNTLLEYNDGKFNPINLNIVQPEQHFDIEMKGDWANYPVIKDGEETIKKLRLKGTIDLITKLDDNTHEIQDYKGLPLDTLIPTPFGWTIMKDISVGDIIYDKDGKETTVTGKSKIKYKKCYKITFDDNSTVTCDEEHLWLLNNGLIEVITDLKINDKIDIAKPIKCKRKKLPIDPYVLGIWLGDGRNRGAEISGKDKFIFQEIKRRGYKIGKDISFKNNRCESRTIYNTTTRLRKLNLLHNKHIPEIYFRSSIQQRLDLLRGLMDSDGYANTVRKQGVFMNCNKRLSEDVKKLLISLGQRPYLSKTKSKGFGLTVDAYLIFFKPININPFLLPRKAKKVNVNWGYGRSNFRRIKKIETAKKQHTQCIMVDSPTHTYLCTENMIPTHNTGARKNWATDEQYNYDNLHHNFQLRLYHFAHTVLYPNVKNVLVTIFYIKDGGPFTLAFDRSDIPQTIDMIKDKFQEIKNTNIPKPNYSWKCKKFCQFGKESFDDKEGVKSLNSKANSRLSKLGEKMCMCDQIVYSLNWRSTDDVIKNMSKPDYNIEHYQAPGET